jgi:MFS family permease
MTCIYNLPKAWYIFLLMQRNILLAYILAYLKSSWFWLGVWVFYYLQFTDYAGIGLIESVMILTMTIVEIPTGAIADILGKKKTLTIAFVLMSLGNLLLAFASSLLTLGVSVMVAAIGFTFYSGTHEALIYDSLKEEDREEEFDTVVARVNSLQLVAMAFAGLVSGVLYALNPSAPFLAVAAVSGIGAVLTLYLKEPAIDTFQFSFAGFIKQNKQGASELLRLLKKVWIMPLVLGVGSVWVLSDEMLETLLTVEFGFSEQLIGPFFALLFLLAAVASQLTPWLRRFFGTNQSIIILVFILAASYLTSPFVGIVSGGIILIIREAIARNLQNLTSVVINKNTQSKYRATVISSFNMVKNIPYVLTAYMLGYMMDLVTARWFSLYLGLIILLGASIYLASVWLERERINRVF